MSAEPVKGDKVRVTFDATYLRPVTNIRDGRTVAHLVTAAGQQLIFGDLVNTTVEKVIPVAAAGEPVASLQQLMDVGDGTVVQSARGNTAVKMNGQWTTTDGFVVSPEAVADLWDCTIVYVAEATR